MGYFLCEHSRSFLDHFEALVEAADGAVDLFEHIAVERVAAGGARRGELSEVALKAALRSVPRRLRLLPPRNLLFKLPRQLIQMSPNHKERSLTPILPGIVYSSCINALIIKFICSWSSPSLSF